MNLSLVVKIALVMIIQLCMKQDTSHGSVKFTYLYALIMWLANIYRYCITISIIV